MLNIDYSTPRKFLMSSGITCIFLGFLLIFGATVFLFERVDKGIEQTITLIDLGYGAGKEVIEEITIISDISQTVVDLTNKCYTIAFSLIGIGGIFFLVGVLMWIKGKK